MATDISKSFGTAIAFFQEGKLENAIAECRKILAEQPNHVDSLQMIGLCCVRMQQNDRAVEAFETALRIQPNVPPICNNLGEAYRRMGRLSEAENLFRKALGLTPKFPEAAFNLGNTLKSQRRFTEALEWFQKAVDWRPNYANAHLGLANTALEEGRVKRAVKHYHEYLRLEPARSEVLLFLGKAYSDLGDYVNAQLHYQKAESLDPDNTEIDAPLGHLTLLEGDFARATHYYQRLSARNPDCLLKRLRVETLCEIVAPSVEYIDDYRTRLGATLQRLQEEPLRLHHDQLHSSGSEPPMTLAYHGRDDRILKEQYAALFSSRISPLELSPPTGRPHLGVVVTHAHEGVYAECLGRLIARLARSSELDVTIVCSPAGVKIIPHLLGESPVQYLVLQDGVAESAAQLAVKRFDMLHYWEVGTDSMNYFLPFFRPAPVQSACWGWPVTTGQPFIQYFVSSQWIEPEQAQAHYTEQLVMLETLPTWYARPPVPPTLRPRGAFGLPEREPVYLCTQNLRKYHPDFDAVLAEILRRDPAGRIYAIEDFHPAIGHRLKARFTNRFPELGSRLVLIPRQERGDYLNLVKLADVVLDTPHYGGGANSIYDAFACETPIVTWPGQFHRGRYAQGACRKLDLPEMIAESSDDYVTSAIRIANETDFRESLARRIRERSDILFADDSAVQQHEQFFLEAIHKQRSASR